MRVSVAREGIMGDCSKISIKKSGKISAISSAGEKEENGCLTGT